VLILAGFSGFVIEHTGFVWFFIWTSLIGIPVALLAVFLWYRVGYRTSIGNLPSRPMILSLKTSCLSWRPCVKKSPVTSRII